MYALFGDELFARLGTVFDRTSRRLEGAAEDYRSRSEAARLNQSRKTFEELLACRAALASQVKSLREHRAAVAARLDQDKSLLRRVVAAREATGTPPAEVSRDMVERDAADVLRRVEAYEDELARCDAELRRLTEGLDRLDRNVDQARLALQQQSDELDRRNAGVAGTRAYRDGVDLANQIVAPGR
jgi:uncharacterized protein YukE